MWVTANKTASVTPKSFASLKPLLSGGAVPGMAQRRVAK